jgi:excisionase family DNA binding protein
MGKQIEATVIKRAVTVEEAAKILGIGRSLAYSGAARGEIPTIRIGKRMLVPLAALDCLLAGKAVA